MFVLEILMISVGLAADAFAVSVCKGLSVIQMKPKHALICGAYFGCFQALMPLIGYWAGKAITTVVSGKFDDTVVETVCAVVAFVLLAIIGSNMIKESFSKEEEECSDCFKAKTMLPMAVATSIDALAAGVALALDEAASGETNIFLVVLAIGIVTFVLSAVGVKIGNIFGARFKKSAELAGGCILIILAIKFLLEGLKIL